MLKKINDIIKPCLIALLDEITKGHENKEIINIITKKNFEFKFWMVKKYFKRYPVDKEIENGTKKIPRRIPDKVKVEKYHPIILAAREAITLLFLYAAI